MANTTKEQYDDMVNRVEKARFVRLAEKKALPPVRKGKVSHKELLTEINKEAMGKKKRSNNHLEDDLQVQIITFVRTHYPLAVIYAVPNGGRRNAIEGARLKKQGVLAGVADLHLLVNGRITFIEVKIAGGKQSDNQKEFQRIVELQGFKYRIIYSVSDIEQILSGFNFNVK